MRPCANITFSAEPPACLARSTIIFRRPPLPAAPSLAAAIAGHFIPAAEILAVQEYGAGNVNDTFLVRCTPGSAQPLFILQRLNNTVFPEPEHIMHNLRLLDAHVQSRLASGDFGPWQMPAIVPTLSGADFQRDATGGFWRALTFIAETECFATLPDLARTVEAGRALGTFHALMHDLPAHLLHDTLPGFHVTPCYLEQYDRMAVSAARQDTSEQADFCRSFIAERREESKVLEDAWQRGELQVRVIHGDPKPGNILFAQKNGRAISIIDMDTCKPGLLHYDIGDCLRSCCNPTGEEARPLEVKFDLGRCRALLQGYLPQVALFFSTHDYRFIFAATRLIAFELGLRFFTDHLAGDRYFKTRSPGHNLRRAINQFFLCQSIEEQESEIKEIVAECARHA
jgi:Ser/Thr protein kinase RdoA (MazF antagonist)